MALAPPFSRLHLKNKSSLLSRSKICLASSDAKILRQIFIVFLSSFEHIWGLREILEKLENFTLDNQEEKVNVIELKESQHKIILLDQLGVIEFIRKEFCISSNLKIGEILSPITNIKPDTIRTYLSRIQKGEILDNTNGYVSNVFNQLKISTINKR